MRASLSLCLLITLATPLLTESGQRGPDPPATATALVIPSSLQGTEIEHALKARQWHRAEQLLAVRIEQVPDSPELLMLLGRVFLIERKPLNAAIAIKKAEALGPIDNATRFTLALAYISLKRADWARPELERLANADRSSVTYEY